MSASYIISQSTLVKLTIEIIFLTIYLISISKSILSQLTFK